MTKTPTGEEIRAALVDGLGWSEERVRDHHPGLESAAAALEAIRQMIKGVRHRGLPCEEIVLGSELSKTLGDPGDIDGIPCIRDPDFDRELGPNLAACR